jgi:hypothetical protein
VRILFDIHPTETIYFTEQHEFWAYLPGSEESQSDLFKNHFNEKRSAYFLITSEDVLDKKRVENFPSPYVRMSLNANTDFPPTDTFSLFGDYIVQTKLQPDFTKRLDEAYKKFSQAADLQQFLKDEDLSGVSICIERNATKARELREKIKSYF